MISREQAIAMRDACKAVPEGVAYSAATMLLVLDSYLALLADLEAIRTLPTDDEAYPD